VNGWRVLQSKNNLFVVLVPHCQYDNGAIYKAGPALADFLRRNNLKATILVDAGAYAGDQACQEPMKKIWDRYWEIGCEPGLHIHFHRKKELFSKDFLQFVDQRMGRPEEFMDFVKETRFGERDENYVRNEFKIAFERLKRIGITRVHAYASGMLYYWDTYTKILEDFGIEIDFDGLPGHLDILRENGPDEPYYMDYKAHHMSGKSHVLRIPYGWDGILNKGLKGHIEHYINLDRDRISIQKCTEIIDRYRSKSRSEKPCIIAAWWHYSGQNLEKLGLLADYAKKNGVEFVMAFEAKKIWDEKQ